MRQWSRKIRGILGLTIVGAVGGAFLGVLWSIGAMAIGGLALGGFGMAVALFSGFGAFSTAGMALLLAGWNEGVDIDALSAWRGAAYGLVAGALAPVGLVFVLNGTFWVPGLGLLVGISSGIGGLLGGGVMIAGRNSP